MYSSFSNTGSGGGTSGKGGKTFGQNMGRGFTRGLAVKKHRKLSRDTIHGITKSDIRWVFCCSCGESIGEAVVTVVTAVADESEVEQATGEERWNQAHLGGNLRRSQRRSQGLPDQGEIGSTVLGTGEEG